MSAPKFLRYSFTIDVRMIAGLTPREAERWLRVNLGLREDENLAKRLRIEAVVGSEPEQEDLGF